MCSLHSLLVYKITNAHIYLLISFWSGIILFPLSFSLGMGFDAIFIKTSTWKWMSCCEEPLSKKVIAPCQVMTYAGQLLKRLILFILFAILLYCLRKGGRGEDSNLFFFFWTSNYLQRSVGKTLSSHLGRESCVRQWLRWYLYFSRSWFASWNADMQKWPHCHSLFL